MLHRFVIRCVSKLEGVSDDDDWFLLEKSIKMRPLRSAEVLDLKFSNYLPYENNQIEIFFGKYIKERGLTAS